ncbi:MAG: permease [Bacillota bacterium]|nr:permease [Bacillota bacterium]MDI3299378.1 permease [Bacillota bacterium]
METSLSRPPRHPLQAAHRGLAFGLFLLVAVAGLLVAKWLPYFRETMAVAVTHRLGPSMVTGGGAAAPAVGWRAAVGYATAYYRSVWKALAVALLLGSAVQVLVPRRWLLRLMGRRGLGSRAVASLVAVPSMMCSCCSAPVTVGMRRSRVSPGAGMAYFLGNPLLNPASLLFTGFVLGWRWSLLRVVMALAMVFGVGALVDRWMAGEAAGDAGELLGAALDGGADDEGGAFWIPWLKALARLSVTLLPEYVVIVFLLGAVRALLFPAMSPALGRSLWLLPALSVAGTLFVIPTAAEIPVVETLMSFGLGAGPAAALLVTLPAVSLPSLAMLGQVYPWRVLVRVAVAVALAGLVSGGAALALGF